MAYFSAKHVTVVSGYLLSHLRSRTLPDSLRFAAVKCRFWRPAKTDISPLGRNKPSAGRLLDRREQKQKQQNPDFPNESPQKNHEKFTKQKDEFFVNNLLKMTNPIDRRKML